MTPALDIILRGPRTDQEARVMLGLVSVAGPPVKLAIYGSLTASYCVTTTPTAIVVRRNELSARQLANEAKGADLDRLYPTFLRVVSISGDVARVVVNGWHTRRPVRIQIPDVLRADVQVGTRLNARVNLGAGRVRDLRFTRLSIEGRPDPEDDLDLVVR